MRPPYVVIGIGNTLRGDDGAGAAVIHALRGQVDSERVELSTCHQLLPEFVEALRDRRGVVFVDASAEIPAGVVRTAVVEAATEPPHWGHRLEPSGLLGRLDVDLRPCSHAIVIGAESFDHGMTFSPAVSTAIGVARDAVLLALRSLGATADTTRARSMNAAKETERS